MPLTEAMTAIYGAIGELMAGCIKVGTFEHVEIGDHAMPRYFVLCAFLKALLQCVLFMQAEHCLTLLRRH